MIRVRLDTNYAKILQRNKKWIRNFSNVRKEGFVYPFLQKRKADYRTTAQGLVFEHVYQAFQPKAYQRTWNLFKAVSIETLSKRRFSLFIDMSEDLQAVKPGSIKFYPRFVVAGISLWNVQNYPKRDFFYDNGGWLDHFGKRFGADYYHTVIREKMK